MSENTENVEISETHFHENLSENLKENKENSFESSWNNITHEV